jgi:hypothetical protein
MLEHKLRDLEMPNEVCSRIEFGTPKANNLTHLLGIGSNQLLRAGALAALDSLHTLKFLEHIPSDMVQQTSIIQQEVEQSFAAITLDSRGPTTDMLPSAISNTNNNTASGKKAVGFVSPSPQEEPPSRSLQQGHQSKPTPLPTASVPSSVSKKPSIRKTKQENVFQPMCELSLFSPY